MPTLWSPDLILQEKLDHLREGITGPRRSSFRMTDATASGYKHSGRPFPRTNWLACGPAPPAARSSLEPILSTAARDPSQQRALLVRVSLCSVSPGVAARPLERCRRGVDTPG